MKNKAISRKITFAAGIFSLAVILMFAGCSSDTWESPNAINTTSSQEHASIKMEAELLPKNNARDENSEKRILPSQQTIQPLQKNDTVKKPSRRLKASLTGESVTSSVYGKVKGVKAKRVAYLTFDDGPSRNNTPKNLNTLKKYGIKATFFVLPQEGVDDIYKRILDEGHEIGNHSYSHDYQILYGMEDYNFRLDLRTARDYIRDKFGYTSALYRFPGGTMGRSKKIIEERIEILKEEGYDYVDWDISDGGTDTSEMGKNPEILVNNVLNGTGWRDSLIVLMHDSGDKTASAEALPIIIQGLKRQGYTFELMTEKIQHQD